MASAKVKKDKLIKPKEALDALNKLTNLVWSEYPVSLLPNGIVLNEKG